jgi:hypothetical protein
MFSFLNTDKKKHFITDKIFAYSSFFLKQKIKHHLVQMPTLWVDILGLADIIPVAPHLYYKNTTDL